MGNSLVIFLIIYSTWFSACNTHSNHQKSSSHMLELKIKLPNLPVYLNQPLPIKVTLLNKGDTSVLVNARMSPGYERSLSRELYAELKNLNTGKPAEFTPSDINRDFSTTADYQLLKAGDSIFTTFDLLEYYPIKNSGHYELILHYQADENLAKKPEGVWNSIVSSQPKELKILPGKIQNEN